MGFVAPLALLGLAFVPLIIAFYMLRLRRRSFTVSSTFLWQALVRDVEANAPWQRLRRSLLLLLQLLLAIALALIVARPFGERPAGLARDLVLVVDASASMAAKDIFPDRLTAAKRAAIDTLKDLPSDGKVSVIAAAETARLVANEASDRGRVIRAIESIEQTNAAGDLSDALKLAGKLADRAHGTEIVVATDDALTRTPDAKVTAPIRTVLVGRDRHNQAIVALAVRPDPAGLKRSVFVGIANLDSERVVRRLQILADGMPVAARDVPLDALRRSEVISDELPAGTTVVEARLSDPTAGTPDAGPADDLALDDSAWAIVPVDRVQKILLVGPGNVYLQNALSLLPNVELYGATPAEWDTTTGKEKFDLIVFDGFLPPVLPAKPILAIAPPATSALGTVSGSVDGPLLGQLPQDEPLLRNVDLTRLHVNKAKKLELPVWARSVIPGPPGSSLLYSGVRDGLPTAVLAFDLRQSDLPLQVAWPILVANLTSELLGLDRAAAEPIAPATPVELPIPLDTAVVKITRPDGSIVELPPSATGAASVTFVETRQLGVYRAEAVPLPKVTPSGSPGDSPTPSPTPSPSPSPSGSGGADVPAGSQVLFAVDLFDEDESNIAPGNGSRLTELGGTAQVQPGENGMARDEWWLPLVIVALIVLMLEWLVYERDGARRLLNWVRGVVAVRPRRLAGRRRG
jgi:Ca-activated chloride channel family protein